MTIDVNKITGLSSREAKAKLQVHGFNELSQVKHSVLLNFILKLIHEPMFLLLIAGAFLYFLLGDTGESLMLLGFVVVIIGITCYQEGRSEKALFSLRKLSSPRAFVIRNGKGVRIAGREVVPDDVIILNEGDTVPADAELLLTTNLSIDESTLTGESRAVHKDSGFVYAGTQVVQGSGYARVSQTGSHTELGKIGKSLGVIKAERTKLQKDIDILVKHFAIFGFIICATVAIVYGVGKNDLLHGFLLGITLAMAILPEELPVVITVFLAMGAKRLAALGILTRKTPVIESLGSATVLCVDKTGTITENKMAVSQLFSGTETLEITENNSSQKLSENFHQLIEYGVLASQRNPFDPMEIAIKSFGKYHLEDTEHWHRSWQLVHRYPLSKKMLTISQVWKATDDNHYMVAAKGAPEDIFDLCHFSLEQTKKLQVHIENMAKKGLRVVGVAQAISDKKDLPQDQHDFDFKFLGLIGLQDPVRKNVLTSVRSCYKAGMRVVMITGDYLSTAKEIAKQIGLRNSDVAITGSDLAVMNDLELQLKIRKINIFARILPEQKLRIVNALKANGEVVAMTGDGINDAPALKAANIGVAMGGHGTDVAREASSMVLVNDDFSSLVTAIRSGRRIYANIKKAIVYLLAVHIPIIGLTVIPVLFKWPLLLLPIHIVFLELIIDPTCSIVFEAAREEPDIMKRPPRNTKEKLFDRKTINSGLLQGGVVWIVGLIALIITQFLGWHENNIRALVFTILVLSNILLIFVNISKRLSWAAILQNRVLWLIVFSTLGVLTVVLTVPFFRELFHF